MNLVSVVQNIAVSSSVQLLDKGIFLIINVENRFFI